MAHQHQISGIFWTPCLSLRVAKVFLWTSNTLQPPDLGEIYLYGSQNDTLLVPGSEPSWRELSIGPDPQWASSRRSLSSPPCFIPTSSLPGVTSRLSQLPFFLPLLPQSPGKIGVSPISPKFSPRFPQGLRRGDGQREAHAAAVRAC